MMIKQQSCFYCNILLYQPLCSTSLTETNDLRVMRNRFVYIYNCNNPIKWLEIVI